MEERRLYQYRLPLFDNTPPFFFTKATDRVLTPDFTRFAHQPVIVSMNDKLGLYASPLIDNSRSIYPFCNPIHSIRKSNKILF